MVVLNPPRRVPERILILPLLRLLTNSVKAIHSLHQQYGQIVLVNFLSHRILFVSEPGLIEEVFKLESKGLFNRDYFYEGKKILFGDGLINGKGDVWMQQRRLMQPIFNKEAIVIWEKTILELTHTRIAEFKQVPDETVNLSLALKGLIQQILLKILFGRTITEINHPQLLINAIDAISEGLKMHLGLHFIGCGKLNFLFPKNKRLLQSGIDRMKVYIQQEIQDKIASPGQDLISLLIQAKDQNGYTLSTSLLADEAATLFFAGQDTTINTLLWFFYLIARHQEVQDKILAEIALFQGEELTAQRLAQYVYTKAALYETLRLYPPVTGLATQALSEVTLGNAIIPNGTMVLLSLYETQHSERWWERPHDFYPEHFLTPFNEKRPKFAYFPFGGGQHSCLGKHLAELEMLLIIISLLREFRVTTPLTDMPFAQSITLKPQRDILVNLNAHSL